MKDLTVSIDPIQDLHGYDNPWPGGGSANKIPDGTDTANGYVDNCYLKNDGTTVSNNVVYISEYFTITASETYTLNRKGTTSANAPSLCFYDSNKAYISSVQYANTFPQTFTAPANAVYCRATQFKDSTLIQLELGSTPTEVVPYSNICPISGWTGCILHQADGKDFYTTRSTVSGNASKGKVAILSNNSLTVETIEASYTYVSSKQLCSLYNFVEGGKYTLKAKVAEMSSDATPRIALRNSSDNILAGSDIIDSDGYIIVNFTYSSNMNYISFFVTWSTSASASVTYSDITLTEGSTVNTIPISWQSSAGTVYGGTLDVTTGVLTVDYEKINLGDVNWKKRSNYGFVYFNSTNYYNYATGENAKSVCDIFKVVGGILSGDNIIAPASKMIDSYYRIIIRSTTVANLSEEEIKTYLAGHYLVRGRTPQTYQLTPTEVTTLLGQNNIWADCGPSTVEYPCDTKLYIQKINAPSDDDMIADAQIESGKYFIVNNNLYLSTTTILAGDPIKPGTNCTLTNLAAALNALNS